MICVGFGAGEAVGLGVEIGEGDSDWVDNGVRVGLGVGVGSPVC